MKYLAYLIRRMPRVHHWCMNRWLRYQGFHHRRKHRLWWNNKLAELFRTIFDNRPSIELWDNTDFELLDTWLTGNFKIEGGDTI